MPVLTRRRVLAGLGLGGAALVGARLGLPALLRPAPPRAPAGDAQAFVARCFEGLDRRKVWDVHVHLVGLGAGGTGCEVSAELRSHAHPSKRLQFDCYLAAAGVEDEANADQAYLDRLLALHRLGNPEGKLVLLPFDRFVTEDGVEAPALSEFHVPNDYALRVAREHPDVVAAASVHPYRADALERLEAALDGGARAVKWLPNAMGIDPASPRCDAFYDVLARRRVPLLTHAGEEKAVDARELQELGNPLRLRRALDRGVTVVVAHCASLGTSEDLDAAPASAAARPRVPSFELFLRLAAEKGYERTLFGDVSAVTQLNRCCGPLRTLLTAEDLHPRLVNGSDYPLPAIDLLVWTRQLVSEGLLTEDDRGHANEVFAANPLLFDLVVKRALAVREGGRTFRFADRVFETAWLYELPPA